MVAAVSYGQLAWVEVVVLELSVWVVVVTWEQLVLVSVDWVLVSVVVAVQLVLFWMVVVEVAILAEQGMMVQIKWLLRYLYFLHCLRHRILLLYFYEMVVI